MTIDKLTIKSCRIDILLPRNLLLQYGLSTSFPSCVFFQFSERAASFIVDVGGGGKIMHRSGGEMMVETRNPQYSRLYVCVRVTSIDRGGATIESAETHSYKCFIGPAAAPICLELTFMGIFFSLELFSWHRLCDNYLFHSKNLQNR